jgi:ABC-type glycerol-3-phosphate transport system substrate-binding protein
VNGTRLDRRDLLKLGGAGAAGLAASRIGGASAAPGAVSAGRRAARQGGPTLKLMTWGGPESAQRRDAGLRAVYPDLPPIEVVVGGQGDFEVANAFRLSLASGEDIPDMIQFNRTQIAEFAAADELLDLGAAYTPVQDDLYTGAVELVKYNDTFVCFPFELKSKLFYYRADLFQEAGIDPAGLTSVTSFIDAGTTLNAKFANSHILNLGPQPAQYWIGELLSAYPDARFADDEGNYQITTHPGFAATFTFLKDISGSGVALPIDDWSSDWQQSWAQEAIAGSLLANWLKFFLPTFAPDQGGKWKVGLWPQLDPLADQRYGSEAGGSVYVVPKRAKNGDQAVDYLTKMFLDKQGSLAVYGTTGTTPLLKSAKDDFMAAVGNATKPADMSDADWAIQPANFFGPEYFDMELASYDYVKILPYDPSAAEEVPILVDWLVKFLAGDADLESALKGAQDDMESQIGNPYEV